MNTTALKIDSYLQYVLFIAMIICFCSLFGIFMGILSELFLGAYQTVHAVYFGLVLQKTWARQHLFNIGIFIAFGCFLGILANVFDIVAVLTMAYITLVPIGMAGWYCHQVRQHYKKVAHLPHNYGGDEGHEDILDANLDNL